MDEVNTVRVPEVRIEGIYETPLEWQTHADGRLEYKMSEAEEYRWAKPEDWRWSFPEIDEEMSKFA